MTFDIHPAVEHFEKSLRNLRCLLPSKTFALFQRCSYYIKLLTNLIDIISVYISYKTTPAWFIAVDTSVPLYTT